MASRLVVAFSRRGRASSGAIMAQTLRAFSAQVRAHCKAKVPLSGISGTLIPPRVIVHNESRTGLHAEGIRIYLHSSFVL